MSSCAKATGAADDEGRHADGGAAPKANADLEPAPQPKGKAKAKSKGVSKAKKQSKDNESMVEGQDDIKGMLAECQKLKNKWKMLRSEVQDKIAVINEDPSYSWAKNGQNLGRLTAAADALEKCNTGFIKNFMGIDTKTCQQQFSSCWVTSLQGFLSVKPLITKLQDEAIRVDRIHAVQ